MHDQKNIAPKENMPIPGKMRGVGGASMNSYAVAVKRDLQNMNKTISDLTGLVLQLSKVAFENMEMLARVEKKLDSMQAQYESAIAQRNLVARPTSDGGLSYVDINHTDEPHADGDTTPLCASHTGSIDAAGTSVNADGADGSTDTGSIISMSAYKVDEVAADGAAVDTSSVPPGVREAVNEEYFAEKPGAEVITQEVIEEDIEEPSEPSEPILLSRAVVAELASPAKNTDEQPVDEPAEAAPAPAAEAAPSPADVEIDIDNIVAKLANTSDADISAFTAPEAPKAVKKRVTKPKAAGAPRKRAAKKVL